MVLSTSFSHKLHKEAINHNTRSADIFPRDAVAIGRRGPAPLREQQAHNRFSDLHTHQHRMAVQAVDVLSQHLHPVVEHSPASPEVNRIMSELQSLTCLAQHENLKWAAAVGVEVDTGLKQRKIALDSVRHKNERAKAALANLRHLLNDAKMIMHENRTAQFAEEVYICGRQRSAKAQREQRAFHLSSVLQQLDIDRRLTNMFTAVVDVMAQLESLSALAPPPQLGAGKASSPLLPYDTAVPLATPLPVHVAPISPYHAAPMVDGLVASNIIPLSGLTPLPPTPISPALPLSRTATAQVVM